MLIAKILEIDICHCGNSKRKMSAIMTLNGSSRCIYLENILHLPISLENSMKSYPKKIL